MTDISGYENFVKIEPITKGWSGDKKYCVTAKDGTKYLLRISPMERYEHRKTLHEMMKRISALDIPMCQPIDFGTCDEGVFSRQSWIEGKDLEDILSLLSETEQYVLGLQSGEILRKIHSIPAPSTQDEWALRFNKKIDNKIEKYRECGIRFDNDDAIISYINQNRNLLKNRLQTLQHGDYGIANMMYADGKVHAIDFSFDYGDPWQDFESIRWAVDKSVYFATGMVRGYFDNEVPDEFWTLLKLYLAEGCLHNIVWSVNTKSQESIDTTLRQIKDVQNWFDDFHATTPKWYQKDFYIQWIDDMPYKLKSPFDFSFLRKYGKVFKVFDDQDSGNICFGVQDGDNKYFVKFAGAPTKRGSVSTDKAISNLKQTLPIYKDLKHPSLINLINTKEIGGGFAMIFDWIDGECPHRMYPLSRIKFFQTPLETRVKIFEDILNFHAHVISKGYVAIDFYDGSILYDFKNDKTTICDIDFFTKKPYTNKMGRLWGSSRFMSPEEFTLGAEIDEITNVYTMGATAFALFSSNERELKNWPLSKALYTVVSKAVSDNRSERQQTIKQLLNEWQAAKI